MKSSPHTPKYNVCVCVCMLSRFSCVPLFATPWTIARQAPLSMGFSVHGILQSRYWSGLPFPSPSQVALVVKILTAIAGDLSDGWVQSLSEKYVLEEGMATHSSILAWRIPWAEEPGWLQSNSRKELYMTETT